MECSQSKCCFFRNSGCPICRECKSPSNIVDDNCVNCWNCMKDDGILRNDIDKKEGLKEIVMENEVY